MNFRADINGLRAIAVLAVVIYHFLPTTLSGGFIGVDVFFVISGYLMTGIVFKKIHSGSFSLLAFYIDRCRRIIPAIIALCTILAILGWLLLIPSDYRVLGKHIAATMAFLSNFAYWSESGYFDSTSSEKWLLHTWSLSVEWQFYMLYPIMILAIKKYISHSLQKITFVLIAFVSLCLSVWMSYYHGNAAFYLLPTRAWELLAGGLVYLFPITAITETKKRALEAAGLATICFSILHTTTDDIWPGALALIPVIGSVLVIYANRQNSLVTSNPASQWLGKISYSVYLWHWPIAVALRYYNLHQQPLWTVFGILLSMTIGQLSFSLIESTSNQSHKKSQPSSIFLLSKMLCMPVILTSISIVIFLNNGFPSRAIEPVNIADKERRNKNPRSKECFVSSGTESPGCIFGNNKEKISAIVIGDSHADAIINAVADAAEKHSTGGILFLGYQSCPTIESANFQQKYENKDCGEFVKSTLKNLENEHGHVPVIVVNRTSVYIFGHNEDASEKTEASPIIYFDKPATSANKEFLGAFREKYLASMCRLTKSRPVYLVKPIPEMGVNIPKTLARQFFRGEKPRDITISKETYQQRNMFVIQLMEEAEKICGVHLLDPARYLCNAEACNGSINGRPLYYDDDHLSEYGNKFLVPLFAEVFEPRI